MSTKVTSRKRAKPNSKDDITDDDAHGDINVHAQSNPSASSTASSMNNNEPSNNGNDSDEEGEDANVDEFYKNSREAGANADIKQRLLITSMTLENFKSYAGKRTIGPFHKSFTSVVGPNGSGKSNVIDAVLFVFGYRASKMRFKKLSELIHKSTENPDAPYAKVTVNFCDIYVDEDSNLDGDQQQNENSSDGNSKANDNDENKNESSSKAKSGNENYRIVPGSEFTVARAAYRDNSSVFTLNGRKVKFDTISKILMDKGIDLTNNRFLILQGEVEQISLMKPKALTQHETGLLEYLEEIIGTKVYIPLIEESSTEAEKLGEQRKLVLDRVRLAEEEMSGLEGSKNEAIAFVRSKKELALTEKEIARCTINEGEEKLQAATSKIEKLEEEIKNDTAAIEAIKAETKEQKKKRDDIDKELQQLRNQLKALKEEIGACEKKEIECTEDIKNLKDRSKKSESDLKDEQDKINKLQTELKALEEKQVQLTNEVAAKNIEKQKKEDEKAILYTTFQEEMKQLSAELKGAETLYHPKQKDLDNKRSQLKETQIRIEMIEKEARSAMNEMTNCKNKLGDIEKSEQSGEIFGMKNQINEKKETIEQNRSKIEMGAQELKKLTEQEQAADAKSREESKKFSSLREKFEYSQRSSEGRKRLVDELLKQQRSDPSMSILGRLGDLGEIDANYDVAVSTASGALDDIVCRTVEGAEKSLKYLRDRNLGRATFIILEKLRRESSMTSPPQIPGQAQRLFDLIKCSDDVKPAFYYALRDTLVARDLDEATAIAYQNGRATWRVVTLNGELIDISGTMAGGGKSMKKGAMSLSGSSSSMSSQSSTLSAMDEFVTREEVDKAKRDADKAYEELKAVQNSKRDVEESIRKMKSDSSLNETNIRQFETKLQDKIIEKENLLRKINILKPKCELSEADQQQLDLLKQQEQSEKELVSQAEQETKKYKVEVEKIQTQIKNVGGAKVDEVQKALDAINKSLSQANKDLTKCNHDIPNTKTKIEKSQKACEKIAEQKSKLEQELSDMMKKSESNKTRIAEIKANMQKIQESEEEKAEILDEEDKSLRKSNEAFYVLEKGLGEKKTEKKKKSEEVDELRRLIAAWEAKEEDHIKKYKECIELYKDDDEVDGDNNEGEHAQVSASSDGASSQQQSPMREKNSKDSRGANSKSKVDVETLESKRTFLQAEIKKLDATVTLSSIAEYKKREEEYNKKREELQEATKLRDEARTKCEGLRKKRLDEFMKGFGFISLRLKEMYQMITRGDAELEFVDSLDPFSEGIQFSVRPPNKSWKNISNLSGGEKTLSSLALVFALHHYKPSPLYVMDEIDAALDFKNVSIIANYISERTKNAQFIIISLRNNMFEKADRLVGIYKTNNATKSVTIDPNLDGALVGGSTSDQ